MISFETFTNSLESGEITKLNFTYESKEYLIVREDREENEEGVASPSVFAFASEDYTAVRFATAKELLKTVTVGGLPLRDAWKFIVPICEDTLLDEDYIETLYGDSLGKVMCSASGTTASHERYLTQYLLPSIVVGLVVLFALLMCALFIPSISWKFFGIAAAIVVAALVVVQIILFSNTKRYRHRNPRAHCYLLYRGVVIITDRFEYAIPYEKIIRLDTEAGIRIVTLKTVFSFTANHGEEITESLKSIFEEVKSIKKHIFKKKS